MVANTVKKIPVFDPAFTEVVADVLAQTAFPGLTNIEIDRILQQIRLQSEAGNNKRERLYVTLHNAQARQGCGNALVAFIVRAMSPARHVKDPKRWQALRDQLNAVLVLHGYRINDEGRLATGVKASTLSEAAKLAGVLRTELLRRDAHPELLRYTEEEVVGKDLFHAMSEAAKSIPARVRSLTGLTNDGAELYDDAFGTNRTQPRLFINSFRTASEISEHKGFKSLLIGIHGHYRNPRAHTTRLGAVENYVDFYDLFSLLSYIHRRLDGSRV
ncbi:TIGR02391 family protein [Nocardia farcinica]|uniref:TIGR02391 family protein n=1 Tax=Nocardia farcinica TaxID=37329 RepID=UPI002B4B5805|nr:TIGR02391 family protein [Nocardia farcinica]